MREFDIGELENGCFLTTKYTLIGAVIFSQLDPKLVKSRKF